MQLVCRCLNVTVNVVPENGDDFINDAMVKPENVQQLYEDDEMAEDDFFGLCSDGAVARFVLDNENGIAEKLPVLVKRRYVGGWEIRKCLLCDVDAFAIGSKFAGHIFVNMKLFLQEENAIAERRKSNEISPVFRVILPKMKEDVAEMNNAAGTTNGLMSGATMELPTNALYSVQSFISQYLRREQEKMEERIREFTEQQHAAFDQTKLNAKQEQMRILELLAQRGGQLNAYEWYWSSGSTVSYTEDEVDSAVALSPSPLSLNSTGEQSPALDAFRMINVDPFRIPGDQYNIPFRPKAHSNPPSLSGCKRKRHSGGPGLAPTLSSHPEEQQDIFSFEEQEHDQLYRTSYLPEDDEGDTTDDSGTGDEYNPANLITKSRTISESNEVKFCTSLPMRVPQRTIDARPCENKAYGYRVWTAQQQLDPVDKDTNNPDENEDHPKDVGASMQALTKSMKCADDPEILFGERPQRRRYQTGGDHRPPVIDYQQPRRVFPMDNRSNRATVLVMFKEGQNGRG